MTVVADASPLIGLSAIGLLDLLHTLYGTIHIPQAVYEEVVIKGKGKAGAGQVAAASWIIRHTITDQKAAQALRNQAKVQAGESEALVLATELSATLIILDDDAARRYAASAQLPFTGTLGVLLAAKAKGLIPAVKKPLDALIAYGIRISPVVYQSALTKAGE